MTATDALSWPQRTESVIWRIYDKDDAYLGVLQVSNADAVSMSNDTTRSIRRTVPNFTIPPRPLFDADTTKFYAGDVDPLIHRVRPWWQVQAGSTVTEYPLGKFVWGDDAEHVATSGNPRKGMLTDLCTLLDQPLDNSLGWGAGTDISDAFDDVLDAAGQLGGVSTQATDTLTVPVGYVAGRDTYLTALDGLCKIAGYLPPYYDNNGDLQLVAAGDVASATPDFDYGFGIGNVIPGTIIRSSDKLTAPNRYVVIGGDPKAELVGIYDVPSSAPNSYTNTGRYVRKTSTVQGLTTQASADQAAVAAYASDISTYSWLNFSARADPRHDTWNVVAFDAFNYREVGWTLQMRAGGTMAHSCRGSYS